jgi:hypothetical protein
VYLALSLVMLRYVDEALLSPGWRWLARLGAPVAAILIPASFFLSVASPQATRPSGLINLAYVGAVSLALAVLTLGIGLIRASRCTESGRTVRTRQVTGTADDGDSTGS